MTFTQRAAAIWRDYVTPLNPFSGLYKPEKPLIRQWGKEIEDQIDALSAAAGFDPSVLAAIRDGLTAEIARATAAEAPIIGRFTRPRSVFSRPRLSSNGDWFGADTFDGLTLIWVPERAVLHPAAIQTYLLAAPNVATVRLTVYRRAVGASLDNTAPGTATDDAVVFQTFYAIGDLLADPLLAHAQIATMPLRGIAGVPDMPAAYPAYGYMVTLEGRTSGDGPAYLGIARGQVPPANATARYRGWARQPGGAWFPLGDPNAWPFVMHEAVGVEPDEAVRPLALTATPAEQLQRFWPYTGTPVAQVVIPESVIEHAGQTAHVSRQLVVFARPAEGPVTDTIGVQPFEIPLSHQYVSGVQVRRQDNNALLVDGVDYTINYRRASILGLKSGVVFCNVSYTGRATRYDIVCVDPKSGAVSVAAGTQRPADAGEFVPDVPLGLVPLYGAFVTRSDGVDLVPLQGEVDVRLKGLPWREYSRQRLPGLIQAMRTGRTIRLAVYGDSIPEQGGGGSGPSYYTVPNGTYRDTALQSQGGYYWTGRIGADVVNALPGYNQGDGNSRHIRVGWGWRLKEAIEAASACTVIHDNWGVGGTDASQTEPNGNYPPRINALIASNPDVVVICFGMNELGGVFTYLRIRAMIQTLRAGGAEVIVMGVPLIATSNSVNSIDEWRETNRQVEQAALDEDAAYVPVAAYVDPDSPVPLGGMSRRAVSTTNGINHDGPYMLRQYGNLLASVVRGL